ncbi:beta-microseminoprotein isoform X2 [Cololabis saira]|uniref:beta-microseminoprotein isoform X2 n=1 Tax=Cololabis saira TaxID=129043 RepID=UPI002AD32680|nr:beta-microseminoprotein isoform X2 [Cololabis saira]
MTFVRVLASLLGLFVLCHCDCFFQELVIKDSENLPKGCVDKDGKHHDFGSEWVSDCMDCSCDEGGLSCCSRIHDVGTADIPEECELVVDEKACSLKMVLKSDKTKECSLV